MFNPYVSDPSEALRPAGPPAMPPDGSGRGAGLTRTLLDRLARMEGDDLLILLLVLLVAKEGEEDGIWPLAAALLYLIL